MTRLQVEDLSLRYPDQSRPVLNGLNFQIRPGERVLLLGPSGAGKSTLLLALMGLIPRSIPAEVTGAVRLGGRPVTELRADQVARQMGLLFQEPESQFCMLYPDDEAAFGLENLGVEPQAMPGRIARAMEWVGLGPDQRQTRTDRLSGGQQQRLALAAILAQDPPLLLLDEPTANLDPAGRQGVVSLAAAAARSGKGLLVVEHNLDAWFPLLERLLILGPEGRLLDDGPPAELFRRWGRYLDEIGVWRPRAVQAAEALAAAGYAADPLPLNAEELRRLPVPRETLARALQMAATAAATPAPTPAAAPAATPAPTPAATAAPTPAAAPAATAAGVPMVEIRGLTAGYPGRPPVLHQIDLTIHQGEFWALVGPNGSGKSTLARTLIGMVRPSAGRVSVLGTEVHRLSARALAQRVGFVFQNPEHQFVTDSVWAELAYSVRQLGLDPARRRERIEWALAAFGLADLAAQNPFSLSGGQKRRLSVATMLVGGQPLLVLDEPTFGQDRRSAAQLMDRVAALNRRGVTVLMITHDLDLVDAYATRVAVLAAGRLLFAGPAESLWSQPDLMAEHGLEPPFRLQVLRTRGYDAMADAGAPCPDEGELDGC